MSTVVVTGVAGELGSRVAARLLADPAVTRVVGIDLVPVDASDPRFDTRVIDLAAAAGAVDSELERAVEGADGLLHLAWKLADSRGSGTAEAAADANARALARVLATADRAGVGRFVHVSSATVYGAWPDNNVPLTEDVRIRPNPEFSFAVTKAEAERVIAEWRDTHQAVRCAVLRPAVTVGAADRPLYRALGITRAPRLGDEGRPVQYLHADDLATAVVLAWQKDLDGVFNVAPDAGIPEDRARQLAGGIARLPVPGRFAPALSALAWRIWRAGVPAEARAYASHPWVVAPDRIKAQGWEPEYSSEEALVATDERLHWDDLPPGRRQNYNLLAVVAASLVGIGGVTAAVLALLRRRRRRSPS